MGIESEYGTDPAWKIHRFANHSFNYGHGKDEGREEVRKEKEEELKQIKIYKNSTTHRRAEFEALNLEKVNYVKSSLLIVYGLLVLWFAYIMFKNKDMKLKQKGILLGMMLAYPYIAPPLLIYLYETIMYIVALMTGEIYKKAELQ